MFEAKPLHREIKKLNDQIEELKLSKTVVELREEIVDLEIGKAKQKEDHDKREREVKHMVGLEKKRSEFDQSAAKREAILEVREENLAKSQERFETEMKFQRDRFETEVGYLKELMGDILDRLPTVTVDKKVASRPARKR
jgi:hypothetical protein